MKDSESSVGKVWASYQCRPPSSRTKLTAVLNRLGPPDELEDELLDEELLELLDEVLLEDELELFEEELTEEPLDDELLEDKPPEDELVDDEFDEPLGGRSSYKAICTLRGVVSPT